MRTWKTSRGILYAAFFAAILLLASCSSSNTGSGNAGGKGSISFALVMPGQESSSQAYKAAEFSCDEYGVVSVEAAVYDENHNLIARGGPWDCNSGGAVIYAVKKGTNRSIEVYLKGADHRVIAGGSATGVTVRAGRTTVIGPIQMTIYGEENIAPNASDDAATVYQGGVVSVLDNGRASLLANDYDPDGDKLTAGTTPVSGPSHGTVAIHADGTFLYTHTDTASTEDDSFSYRITDPDGKASIAVVHISVIPGKVNAQPVLSDGLASPEQGLATDYFSYRVSYYDEDGNAPEYVSITVDGTEHAMTLYSGSASNGVYQYRTLLALGNHSYSFTCSDGHGGAGVYPASGTYQGPSVVPENHTPMAVNDHTYVNRNGMVSVLDTGATSVLANDTAAAGLTLTVNTTPVRPPAHGELDLKTDGTFLYQHDGSTGTYDSFSYQITDSSGHTAVATVGIDIKDGDNQAPVLDQYALSQNTGDTSTLFTYSVHYFDQDGNPPAAVTITVDGVSHAMAYAPAVAPSSSTAADGVYVYTTSLAVGSHSASLYADDGHGGHDSGLINGPIVYPPNKNPLALNDSAVVARGGTVTVLDSGRTSVLANDFDPEGQALTADVSLVANPQHGEVQLRSDGTFSYKHNGDSSTSDSFTYRVTDGHGGDDTAMVIITVTTPPDNHTPVLSRPDVGPRIGDTGDQFTFFIRYFDPDREIPGKATVVIDGIPRDMSLIKGAAINGIYALNTSLSQGIHSYYFSFTDASGNPCRYPAAGSLAGPIVLASMERYCVAPAPLGSDSNDGSAAHPFATIGHALETAHGTTESPAGIRVAAGVYQENIAPGPWESVEGGWNTGFTKRWDFFGSGISPTAEYETVVSSTAVRCVTLSSAEGSSVEGITVRGDQGFETPAGVSGVLIQSCSPVIRYCIIEANLAQGGTTSSGGGMSINGGSPLIQDCLFLGNRASNAEANFGGGLSILNASPSVLNCSFTSNFAGCSTGAGGAIYTYRSSPLIQDCLFTENGTCGESSRGGAIYNKESSPVIADCVFISNLASGETYAKGGAIYNEASNPVITGCSFTGNAASACGYSSGGAMYNDSGSSPVAANCIFWGDSSAQYPEICTKGTLTITFSDIAQDGFLSVGSNGNIRLDPLFKNPGSLDLSLKAGSPCIDAGSADVPGLPVEDFAGIPRILNGYPDMGAFEWWTVF